MTAPSPSTLPRSAGGLIEVQRALYRRLVAVAGAPEGWGPGNGSSADAAFEVYTRSRRARLEEVLSDDYPRVRALLGADRFGALVEAYLEAHPPRDPALRNLGAQLPEFVAGGARDGCSLAQELARLEWLWVEVFDAPNEPTLDRSALMRIAPEAWPGLQLQLAEAWRIEHFGHRVETYSLEEPERLPEAVPTTLIIFRRRDFQVFARPLDDAEARALDQVGSGATFGEICEALAASELGLPEAAEKAASYVATWLDDALIRDVHVP